MKFKTLSIHGGYHPDSNTDAIPPMHLSTTFEHRTGSPWLYSRVNNPNREMLEKLVAKLDNGTDSFAFSSGVAAINAVLQLIPPGSTVVAGIDLYHGARLLLNQSAEWRNFNVKYVDLSLKCNYEELAEIKPSLLWLETPSNPNFVVSDIKRLCAWAKGNSCLTAVDSTWLSPVYMKPLDLGADITVHSATKYLSGHSDVLAGMVVVKDEKLAQRLRNIQIGQGAVLDPFDCWMLIRSIKTLDIRMKAQSYSASRIAQWLTEQKWVSKVLYPGLLSGEERQVHTRQAAGNGCMVCFLVNADVDEVRRFAGATHTIINATSLGGVESTWEHRYTSEGPESKTSKELIRFSVGLEDVDDLISDISEAARSIGLLS